MELKLNMDFEQLLNLVKQLPKAEKEKLMAALQTSTASPMDKKPERELGKFQGKIWMSDDFNEPLDDFNEYSK